MTQVNFFSFSFAPETGLGYILRVDILLHEVPMSTNAVSFIAKSGTGKTTLLEKVIAELKGRGYRIGVIKHDAHHFDIDHPGKDSHRLTQAGADTMLISSPEKLAVVKTHTGSPPIEELIAIYFSDVDLILTEGFKKSGLPKIELHRAERSATLLCRGEQHDSTLLAVASDEPLELDVPILDINNPGQVADFIEQHIIHATR
jgi:molybdopterin-guanine dinucleotide biosynthesis protein B/molybdopterin-guanine dinucleotide biosynthesis protein